SRCCCNIAVLLVEYQYLPTDVWGMHLANVAMSPRLGSGELDCRLRLRLHDLFNTEVLDLEAMGFVQFIDQGEFNFIALLHHQGRRQPDLGPIEEHVDQGKLFRFSRGAMPASQDEHCEAHTEPAELHTTPLTLAHLAHS